MPRSPSFDPQLHAEDGGAGLEVRCLEQLKVAKGGTEEMGALQILARGVPRAHCAFAEYRDRAVAESDEASLLRYARLRAGSCTVAELEALLDDPALDMQSPNMIRATLGGFAQHGNRHFHAHDGSGYACVTQHILALDAHTPSLARDLLQAFKHYEAFADDDRQAHMRAALERVGADASSEGTRALAQRIMGAAGPVRGV